MGLDKFRRKGIGKGTIDARGGLYSRGVPVFGSPGLMTTGTVYHVSSTASNASDSNSGLTPDQPLATIDAGINKCTANKGDIVLVHQNHAETILTDAAIDADTDGISVVGLGQGNSRPVITMGATATGASTAATVEINAANVRLENLLFVAGIDALVKAVHVIGDDFSLVNCEFREASAKQMLIAVNVGAANNDADRCKILGNKFVSVAAGATSAISLTQLQDAVEIVGNYIDGDYSDAGIQNPTGEICTNLLLQDNIVSNRSTGNHAIQLVSACTGLAVGNMMYGDTLGTILDPGSLKCLDNKETDAIDQAGVDSPRTSAGGFPDASITAAVFAAGAIDAAAIANSAIDAATFAAGAIDAAAIANGAIDAATFAAGAIDAAAIANSAIDAATFAAGAIDAAAVADGAVDRATFAADTGLQTIRSNTAAAGAAGTITLDASANASDDFYNNQVILLTGGTGVGQARLVSDYTGATKVADVSPNWVTNPDNTSTFAILPSGLARLGSTATGAIVAASFAAGAIDAAAIANSAIDAATFAAGAVDAAAIADSAIDRATFAADTGLQTIRSNTAAAGAAATITLDASASASDDFYNNAIVLITGGTGVGQARLVSDYTGATKVADVIPNWVTTPDNTSTFAVIPSGLVRVGSFATGAIVAGAFAAGAIDDTAVAAGAISEIGTITNTGGTATIGAVLGDLANDSLVARLNDIGSNVDSATTDNLQGKLGTDTEMADRSVYDLINGGGPAAAAAAAAPANDVSLYGAVRAVYDRQLGDGTTTNANSKLGKKVTKAAADIIDGTQKALFTVSGGRILLTSLSVETAVAAISAGLCNVKFRTNPTVGTDMDLSANLDIDGDEVGSLYSLSGIVTDATTGGNGGGAMTMQRPIIVAEGTIDIVSSSDGGFGGATGVSQLWYFPLDDTASVAAA